MCRVFVRIGWALLCNSLFTLYIATSSAMTLGIHQKTANIYAKEPYISAKYTYMSEK